MRTVSTKRTPGSLSTMSNTCEARSACPKGHPALPPLGSGLIVRYSALEHPALDGLEVLLAAHDDPLR